MAKKFEKVAAYPICLKEGAKYQVELIGSEVVVSKEVEAREWENVTNSCYPEFRQSQHKDGRYIMILYQPSCRTPVPAAVIGTRGLTAQKGFKVMPAPDAYTSFQIFKKCR